MTRDTARPSLPVLPVVCAILAIASGGAALRAENVSVLASFELGDSGSPPIAGTADILGAVDLAGPDWSDLFNADGTPRDDVDESGNAPGNGVPDVIELQNGRAALFIRDDVSLGEVTDLTTRLASGRLGTGLVPADEDLGNAYVYVADGASGETLIYVGVERLGTHPTRLDIELIQDVVRPGHRFPTKDGWEVVGDRTVDDLRLRVEYGNGARLESVTVERWADDVSEGEPGWLSVARIDDEGCNEADETASPPLEAERLCAFLNSGSIPGGEWESYDANGAVVTDLGRRHFTEIGLDATRLTGRASGAPPFRTVRLLTASDLALGHFEKGGLR